MTDKNCKIQFDYFQYLWSIFVSLNHILFYCCGQIKIKNLYAGCLFNSLCYTETKVTFFRFRWPCIMSKLWSERENQQDATVRCLFSTISQHVSGIIMPIFRRTRRITARGVLRWFCWMWLVAVVGRCVVGCCILLVFSIISQFAHNARSQKPKA